MKLRKVLSAIMISVSIPILLSSSCQKTEDPNNGENGGGGAKSYYIHVSSNPADSGTVTGDGTYEDGESCTVTATAASGYTFNHWTENGEEVSTESTYSFIVHCDRNLVANFSNSGGGDQPKYFRVSVEANPEEGGSVWGSGTFREGQSCTIEAAAENAYAFANWTDEHGDIVSTELSYTFTVERNCRFWANFTHNIIGGHEYVDLGLPSGLLWAVCNVGAANPEEFGYYFAWGETERKTYYDVASYEYAKGDDLFHPQLTKYCYDSSYGYQGFTDNLTALLPEDDAATANWGEGWRMPSKEEWEELLNHTSLAWITQNGVEGLFCTGSNGYSLFLPPAGFYSEDYLWYAGATLNYHTSSLYKGEVNEPWGDGPDCAWDFGGSSSGGSMATGFRYAGRSVRAVCAKPQ